MSTGKLPIIVAVAGAAGLLGLIVWLFTGFLSSPPPSSKQTVQQINVVRPPPPPPPPPQVEEPPPPEVEEEVDVPEPEEIAEPEPADLPPPGEALGLDAEGVAGSDGFGLLARRGGRDLLATGGNRFDWYAGVLQRDILDFLSDNSDLRRRRYDVVLSLWLEPNGSIREVEVLEGSGNAELDSALFATLENMSAVGEKPPADLPQPIRIRIVSRL